MTGRPSIRRCRGFTLLEITIAIAIFAVLSAMSYGALTAVLEAGDHSRAAAGRLEAVQRALWFLASDLQQLRPRPVRDAFGDTVPALVGPGDGTLELTRGGWSNPLQRPRSNLRRVGYRLHEDTLERLTWNVLDRPPGAEPDHDPLLTDVTALELRFMVAPEQWSDSWPPPGLVAPDALPMAVEVRLELADWGIIDRLFRIRG